MLIVQFAKIQNEKGEKVQKNYEFALVLHTDIK